jgi:hypothetical protein
VRRDVTVLLSVDGDNGLGAEPRDAVAAINVGHQAVVHDDATAVLVLMLLGLTKAAAVDQVRSSYGPLLNSSHPQVMHLKEMLNGE